MYLGSVITDIFTSIKPVNLNVTISRLPFFICIADKMINS